jgi:hypothetical protein
MGIIDIIPDAVEEIEMGIMDIMPEAVEEARLTR